MLACTLRREDPRDVLIFSPDHAWPGSGSPLAALRPGALVGSSSVRRQAQLLHARPDLRVATIRGNVNSRLDKVRGGEFAASLLALAGLVRLGHEHEADAPIDPEIMVPAGCQGIVGITARIADRELHELLAASPIPTRAAPPLPNERCSARLKAPATRRSAPMPGCYRTAACASPAWSPRRMGTSCSGKASSACAAMARGQAPSSGKACAATVRATSSPGTKPRLDGLRDGRFFATSRADATACPPRRVARGDPRSA